MKLGEAFVTHLSLIGELDADDRAALLGMPSEEWDIKRGEDVLSFGQKPDYAVAVLDGLLQRYNITAEGVRQIGSVYIPSDVPCLETVHIGMMDNNLGALAPSRVGIVAHRDLFAVMRARPNVLALCWRETLVQASVFREWLIRNSRLLAHAQLAHFFCELLTRARAAGLARGHTMDLPLSQEDLGAALGMSSVHVNRTLMILRTGGLLEFRGGRLEVFDWPALVDIAEFDSAYLHLRPGEHPKSRAVA